MRRKLWNARTGIVLLALNLVLSPGCAPGGCAAMGAIQGQDVMKTVKPEYQHLNHHKLAILVRVMPKTDYEFPELAGDLAAYVQSEIKAGVKDMRFVSSEAIRSYQDHNIRWADIPDVELGAKFKAEMVLALNVDFYTLTLPGQTHYQQGRLTCHCALYDLSMTKGDEKVWEKPALTVSYPPENYMGLPSRDEQTKKELLKRFSAVLTDCFRLHQESAYER